MKRKIQILATVGLASLAMVATTRAETTEENPWQFDASLNLFLAGMSGDLVAKGLAASVDPSAADLFKHLEAGAAGRFTVGYERWFLSTEFSYLNLRAENQFVEVDLEQWLVEPSIGYEVCQHFQAFVGARYNNISGDVTFASLLGYRATTGTQEWWDPIVGVNLSLPLIKDKLSFDGRFDVGGFGVGSDLTWQAYPYLNWRFAKWGSVQLGYRWLGTDYETGSGPNRFRYDVVVQGFQLGLTAHF